MAVATACARRTPSALGPAALAALAALLSLGAAIGPAAPARAANDALFARLEAERRDFYLQEVFEFTLAVFSRNVNLGREIALANDDAPGLRFLPYQDLGGGTEEFGGRTYEVRRFRGRAQAVATGASAISVAVRVSIVVPRRGGAADSPPAGAEVGAADIRPPPLAVQVRPLPGAGKPAGFSGAVGSFTFGATLRPVRVAEGEPVTLTMEIRGSGNVESVAPPPVPADERFKVYDPRLVKKEIGADRSRGRLVYEQALVPRSTAATALPAVTFSFFDPAARAYREAVAGPFPLAVTPSTRPAAVVVEARGGATAARRRAPLTGIAPPKPEPAAWTRRPWPPLRPPAWFLALQLVPLAVATALLFAARRREAIAADVVRSRREIAPEAPRPGLEAAAAALGAGDAARFHEAVWSALASYFSHRLNLRPGEISGESVAAGLALAGVDQRITARVGEIFRLTEEARFAPRPSSPAPLAPAEGELLAARLAELRTLLESCEGSKP